MKKSLLSLLIFALVFTMAAPAFAATGAAVNLSDISNSYAKEEIEALVEAGIIGGYADGTFKPANSITRAEFAKILALVLDLEEDAAAASVFTDVPAWAKGYVGALVNEELTTGVTATTYGSSQNISREQLATFFVRAWGLEEAAEEVDLTPKFNDADKVAPYAKANVALAGEIGFINGLPNGNFDPKGNAQRQAVARLAYEFYTNSEEYLAAAEEVIKENAPVPAQIEVESVKASNLKQVEVTFNGAVDKETALETYNYTIDGVTFDDLLPELSADEKTVTLTVAQNGGEFENQEEVEITINGVLSKDKETEVTDKKVKFTPVDNTIPTVAEVKALGPKALHVVFSEPVKEDSARSLVNYKIDDQSISGNVIYSYPNEVIIETSMTIAEHKLSVLNVEDYFGLKVAQSGLEFTVQEDTEAPEISEVISKDLLGLEIHFDEPVKSISKVYHTSDVAAHRDSQPTVRANKVLAGFENPMAVNGTTVYAVDVVDYNGNKATRSIEVKPEIDTTRPFVTNVKVDTKGDDHVITLKFNKSVNKADAEKASNYTFLDKDDKKVNGKGISNGNPVLDVNYNNNREVTITLLGKLASGNYTLEVANIKDNSYMKNTMLPEKHKLSIGDTSAPSITQAWYTKTPVGTDRYDYAVYVQFSKEMAHEGTGNVMEIAKYAFSSDTSGKESGEKSYQPFPTNTTINSAGNNTYKISLPRTTDSGLEFGAVRAQLVADKNGNFPSALYLTKNVADKAGTFIGINSVTATSKTEVEVEFASIVSYVTDSDFYLEQGNDRINLRLTNASPVSGKTVATFKTVNDRKLPANPELEATKWELKTVAQAAMKSENSFGIKVEESTKPVEDGIAPTVENYSDSKKFRFIANEVGASKLILGFDEPISVVSSKAIHMVSVKVNGLEVEVTEFDADGKNLVFDITTKVDSDGDSKVFQVKRKGSGQYVTLDGKSYFEVSVLSSNETGKIITDAVGNAVKAFTSTESYTKAVAGETGNTIPEVPETDVDQDAVDAEKDNYETDVDVVLSETSAVGDNVTAEVLKLVDGKSADNDITVTITGVSVKDADDADVLSLAEGKVTLQKLVEAEETVSGTITVEFEKNGKKATKDIRVTVKAE